MRPTAWMVRRGEIEQFVTAWLQGHGLSVGSEALGRSSRVRRAAPRLPTQPDAPAVAGYGLAKTATLTVLHRLWTQSVPNAVGGEHLQQARGHTTPL